VKLLFSILLTIKLSFLFGQGTYLSGSGDFESTRESDRRNYFLSLKGDHVTLYGWELNGDMDTIYYKATASLKIRSSHIRFSGYEFSKLKPTRTQLQNFQPDKEASMPELLLHKYLNVLSANHERFEVFLIKDAYDSNANKFVFVRLK
jgi:hypothetical protein